MSVEDRIKKLELNLNRIEEQLSQMLQLLQPSESVVSIIHIITDIVVKNDEPSKELYNRFALKIYIPGKKEPILQEGVSKEDVHITQLRCIYQGLDSLVVFAKPQQLLIKTNSKYIENLILAAALEQKILDRKYESRLSGIINHLSRFAQWSVETIEE